MTKEEFLNMQIPNYTYCQFHKGFGTRFNESIHIKDSNKKIQINIFWRDDEYVSIGVFDEKEKNPWKQTSNLFGKMKASEKMVLKKLEEIMTDKEELKYAV
jgi:hypothetical protein